MPRHRTMVLALFVLLCGGAALLAYWRLDHRRGDAAANQRELAIVHAALVDIARSTGAGRVTGRVEESELMRRISDIAAIAGVPDKLTSLDPGFASRLGNSDYNELPVYLRFQPINLQQLTLFAHQLAAHDIGSRAKQIELTPVEAGS